MRKGISVLFFPLINYIVAFIVLPFSTLKISGELFTLIVLALWLVAVSAWERRYLKIRHILYGVVPMWVLVLAYCPNGLYGIGNDGILDFSPKEFDALLVCIAIALFQVVTELIIRTFLKIWKSIHRSS